MPTDKRRRRSEFVDMFDDCVQIQRPEWLTDDQWRLAVTKINAWWDGLRHYVAYNADVEYIVNGVIVVSQYGERRYQPRLDHLISPNARTWITQ